MPRPDDSAPLDAAALEEAVPGDDSAGDSMDTDAAPGPAAAGHPDLPGAPDLSALPIAGITRRRVAFLLGAFVTAWIVIVFARQVGDAASATARADAMREANARLEVDLAALERELELIQRQEFVTQQARGYRLGGPDEVPFTLEADAPPLSASAPGSAAARLGGTVEAVSPLESWLSLLFGPEP